ncbi:MAG: tail fiber domain-containing protein [Nanoarchaeota archaeon]|nr:tail fiber domain-containing protein [Nanoarchaeota archaeon]
MLKRGVGKIKNKTVLILLTGFLLLFVTYAEASTIRDFSEIRYSGNLLINASSLIVTNATDNPIAVGIGTSSPGAKLEVINDSAYEGLLLNITNGATDFVYNATTGNVGIGTTVPTQKLQIVDSGAIMVGNEGFLSGTQYNNWRTVLGQNLVMQGTSASPDNFITPLTTSAGYGYRGILMGYDTGIHFLGNSSATTAGATTTPTYLMTILDSGNVGIGTASPGAKLEVNYGENGSLCLGDVGHGVNWPGLANCAQLSVTGYALIQDATGNYTFINKNSDPGYISFRVANVDKMVINQDGNVGIGTTAPGAKLAIQGTGTYGSTNWGTASDMAIRSSEMTDSAYHSILQLVSIRQSLTTGNAANGYLGFSTIDDSNGQGMLDAGRIAIVNEGGGNRNSPTALSFWTNPGGADDTVAATEKVRITSGGNVGIGMTPTVQFELSGSVGQKATGTAWSNPSDIKIKDVLRPFSDGLKVLEGIHPIYYKLNGKGGVTPDGEEHIGIVAQDIQKVAPYTVSSYKAKLNKEDKEDTDLLRFDASALTFVTINAVKEQQTQIEDLKSENEALKSLVCLDHPEAKVCKKGVASEQPVQPVNETEMPSEQVVPVEAPVIPVNIAIPYCDLQTGVCNSAPVIDSFSPEGDVSMSVGGSQEFSVVKSDADNDTLSTQWYVDNLAVADQVSDSYTFASSELGVFEVKVLVTDGKDYSTHKWVVTVEEGQSFGITGAAVSKVNLGRNALLSWIKSLFY